jgi:hypothetical protein
MMQETEKLVKMKDAMAVLKRLGWLRQPYDEMAMDRLEERFNEDIYIMEDD